MTRKQKIIDITVLLVTNQNSRIRVGADLDVTDVNQRLAARRAYTAIMSQYLELTRRLEELTEDYNPDENMYYALTGETL